MSLITSRADQLFRQKFGQLVEGLKDRNLFYAATEIRQLCNNCIWDAVQKASTGRYNQTGPQPFTGRVCPVCKNVGQIVTVQKRRINAIVTFSKVTQADESIPLPAGEIPKGYARVQVEIGDLARIRKAHYYLVDGIRYTLVGRITTSGLKSQALANMLLKEDK